MLKDINFSLEKGQVVSIIGSSGSGKTTLLVSRIIRLLSDRSLGIAADSLAIMTFTRNAAAQLREKLRRKLKERIKELSADNTAEAADMRRHLSEQMILLRSASIGTFDSFCISLIKENVQAFSLPMNFVIADNAKVFSMQAQAMKHTLSYFYEKNDGDSVSAEDISPEERRILFCTFSFEDDEALQQNLLSVYKAMCCYDDREAWMQMCLDTYSDFESMTKKFVGVLINEIAAAVTRAQRVIPAMSEVVNDYLFEEGCASTWNREVLQSLRDYVEYCRRYCRRAQESLEQLKSSQSINALAQFSEDVGLFCAPDISRKDPKSTAKKKMTQVKKRFTLPADLAALSINLDEEKRIFEQQKTAIGAFIKLLKKYDETYRSIMHTSGALDFSECEYLLLEKLRSDDDLRRSLSKRFSCIIVDEFQDSNDIQAEIFNLLSNGRNNLFYVGDVKQSIYAFRGGNPKIMEKLSCKPNKLCRLCTNRFRKNVLVLVEKNKLRAVFKVKLPKGLADSKDLSGLTPAKLFRSEDGGFVIRRTPVHFRRKRLCIPLRGNDPGARLKSFTPFTVIPLNKNFRSRANIVDSVNEIFSGLMTTKYGGVDYANGAQLALGSDAFYEKVPEKASEEYCTEIHLLNYTKEQVTDPDSADEAEITTAQKQARFVAKRIEELVYGGFLVTDNGKLRPVRYGDIAVLMRGNKNMRVYKEALTERSIPSMLPKDTAFLSSDEIALTIDLLRIIDDPLKDEPLLRVLMSPLYGFSADEIAQIRLGLLGFPLDTDIDLSPIAKLMKNRTLFGCITFCSRETESIDEVSEKAKNAQITLDELTGRSIKRCVSPKVTGFLKQLEGFRFLKSNSSVEELIRTVCDDTEMFNLISTYEGSRQRVANLRLLQKYASDFENADGGTLSDFLRFLDRLGESSLESANAPEDAADAVRFMTFHSSKGLEMPVCILAGLDSPCNNEDASKPILRSHEYGLAMNYVNPDERYKIPPLPYRALKRVIGDNSFSEELRLLYVSLTRPIDKLIITAVENKPLADLTPRFSDPASILSDRVPIRWIVRSMMRYSSPSAADAFDSDSTDGKCLRINNTLLYSHTSEVSADYLCQGVAVPESEPADEALTRSILHKLSLEYPNRTETVMQAKYSVTELAHSSAGSATDAMVYLNLPSFAKKGQPTGKEIGDAYHHFMEHAPLEEIRGAADIEAAVRGIVGRLADSAKISETERMILTSEKYGCAEKLTRFFESDLGQRMLSDLSRVSREMPFYAEVPADKLGLCAPDGSAYTGNISLQGRTDLFFLEGKGSDEGIVLVDYKSDTAANLEKELDNYCRQLLTYKEILPQVTGKQVKQVYIFGFSEGVTIDVEEWLNSKGN